MKGLAPLADRELFEHLLRGAVEAGASDLHLKAGAPVMFRIGRELRSVEVPVPTDGFLSGVLGDLIPEHLRDRWREEHEVDFSIALPEIGRFRVNLYQQRSRLAAAIRVVRSASRDFEELRLPPIVRQIAEVPRGIILLAGAPGSGKSTTLAAIIQHLNATVRKHIITLEDPIEYAFDDQMCVIEQREIGVDTASFKAGLHNVLRQDPDVLVIGEMRDGESARAAVSAANVGALVLATLHTQDAAKSIQRVLEFFPAEERELARRQIASTLRGVICQRLMRAHGGELLPAVEVMINTAGVAKLIETNRLDQLPAAIELGGGDGMQSFEQSIMQQLADGQITEEEALAHVPSPDSFRMRLKGLVLSESRRILGSR